MEKPCVGQARLFGEREALELVGRMIKGQRLRDNSGLTFDLVI